ncbi:MAG: YDG domain-containing protein, partial [Fibromonadales bacterium]|nr:YDG domain-containing protein [Fibromonadales bacterium]
MQLAWTNNGTVHNKTYDGTTTATINTAPTLIGVLGSDEVTPAIGSVNFNNANAGTAKPVTVTGYRITGTSANNYATPTAQPAFATANITPLQVTWTPACGHEYIYNGKMQNPTPSATGYELTWTGAGTNADSYTMTAELETPDKGVSLQNAACPYTIAKKPITVTWHKESEYVYNKYTQGPTATIEETGIDWRIVNTYSGAGKYTAANHLAPYVEIISSNADNYELLGNTTDYEILKKDLTPKFETTLPDFTYKNDTLRVPSEVFQDTAALQQILDSIVAYEGFATDTVKKETDDAKVLKGKAEV